MSFKKDLIQLCKPYYIVNLILTFSYIFCKRTPGICTYLFGGQECELDGRETEILFFLLIVVMIRTRKAGSVSMINYLSASFIYTKVANMILWFYADFIMGAMFGIIFVVTAFLLPEPTYSGPDRVIYFRGINGLEEELNRDKNVWLVAFYTVWNPVCVNLAPIFAELSVKYDLDNFKFGKIDVGRYPEAAKKFRINDSSISKQLPTLILFKAGQEVMRRPTIDGKLKVMKFSFTEENIRGAFDVKNVYDGCRTALKDRKAQGRIKSD